MNIRKICVVTGSRPNTGLLRWLLLEMSKRQTSSPNSWSPACTWRRIRHDGERNRPSTASHRGNRGIRSWPSDTPAGMVKSLGLA